MSDSGSGVFSATGATDGWDIESAKPHLGIDPGDSGQDLAIQRVLDFVIASVEKVLQRGILWDVDTLTLYDPPPAGAKVLLYRYPIINVFEINDATPPTDLIMQRTPGWLRFVSAPTATISPATALKIEYEGGYQVFPADLEHTLWEIVQSVWAKANQDTGGPSTALAGGGDVKAITVFDAFRVEYASASDSAASGEVASTWGWLAPWADVLDLYRSESGTWIA